MSKTSAWGPLFERTQQLAEKLERLTEAQIAAATAVVSGLTGVHTTLSTMEGQVAALPDGERAAWRPVLKTLAQRYYQLSLPLYQHADTVAAVPLLVAGGLALTAVAVAWALVAYEYVRDLQGQTELAAAELQARVDALNAGKQLPASTLDSPSSGPSLKNAVLAALGLGVLGAGFYAFRRAA